MITLSYLFFFLTLSGVEQINGYTSNLRQEQGLEALEDDILSHTYRDLQNSFMGADWELSSCCNTTQIVLSTLISVYSVVIFFCWRWTILQPFKLISVFLHEFGHASATWLTCGSVKGMEVHSNEGGVTKSVGGNIYIILPAGYLGSSFWGAFFVVMSVDNVSVQVASGLLVAALCVVFFLADSNVLRGLCILFLLLLAAMWVCQILTEFKGLQYFVLFMGTMNGWFAIYDCYDDLIIRKDESSDASKFAKLTGTSARCWGVIWALVAMVFMGLGIYLALVAASGAP